jgi:hypothetical protein
MSLHFGLLHPPPFCNSHCHALRLLMALVTLRVVSAHPLVQWHTAVPWGDRTVKNLEQGQRISHEGSAKLNRSPSYMPSHLSPTMRCNNCWTLAGRSIFFNRWQWELSWAPVLRWCSGAAYSPAFGIRKK